MISRPRRKYSRRTANVRSSFEMSQSQTSVTTPLRQLTITESFKCSKPKLFKMPEPFDVSSVSIVISDSDEETPPGAQPQFVFGDTRIKSEDDLYPLNLSERIESPSPPKKPKIMISVHKPGTSTPTFSSQKGAFLSTPTLSAIGSPSTPNGPFASLLTVSPHSSESNSSSKTIKYSYDLNTSNVWDEPTEPFPINFSASALPVTVTEGDLLLMNYEENALDPFLLQKSSHIDTRSSNLEADTKKNTAVKRLDFSTIVENNANKKERKRETTGKNETTNSAKYDQNCNNTESVINNTDIQRVDFASKIENNTNKKERKRKTAGKNKITNSTKHDQNCNNTESVINNTDIQRVDFPSKIENNTNKKERKRKTAGKNETTNSTKRDQNCNNTESIINNTDILAKKRRKRKNCSEPNDDKRKVNSSVKENSCPKKKLTSMEKKAIVKNTKSVALTPALRASTKQTENIGNQSSIEKMSSPTFTQNISRKVETSPREEPNNLPVLATGRKDYSNNYVLKKKENLKCVIDKLYTNKELSVNLVQRGGPDDTSQNRPKRKTPPAKLCSECIDKTTIVNRTQKKNLLSNRKGKNKEQAASKSSQPIKRKTDTSDKVEKTHLKDTPKKIIDDGQQPCCSKSLVNEGSSVRIKQNTSSVTLSTLEAKNGNTDVIKKNCVTHEHQKIAPDTPPKSGTSPPNTGSPNKNKQIKNLKCKEGKNFQDRQMKELEKLFEVAKSNLHLRALLNRYEYDVFRKFKAMGDDKKYFVMKLFVWKRVWYGIFKFCSKANIVLVDEKEIIDIYAYLREEEIIDTDYRMSSSLSELLERLDRHKVKEVMEELRIKPIKSKAENMKTILAIADRQATLTTKSFKDLILDRVEKKMGMAMKIKEDVYNAFYNIYLLATFSNPQFYKVEDYFNMIIHQNVVFPEASVEDYPIFYSREKFINYKRALQMRIELDDQLTRSGESKFMVLKTNAEYAYEQLFGMDTDDRNDHLEAPHLKRYSAQHVFTSILSSCCERIFTKKHGYPSEVKKWLEFLIKKFPNSRRLGQWYEILIKLHIRHLDNISYESASKVLIEALDTKKLLLGERAKYDLGKLGNQLITSRKHKIDQMYHDRVTQLIPRPIETANFPAMNIDSPCIRSEEPGRKREYVLRTDGGMTIRRVEKVALDHYAEGGYPGGEHCEGNIIKALLMLFFWDIIYNPSKTIPGVFISKLQSAPLDMFTPYFYTNRKELIDKRLEEIEFGWSEEKLINFAASTWQHHSHQTAAFGVIMETIKDQLSVEVFIVVIGRKVLTKVFDRLIKNIREFRSGMPDLLVWNIDKKECKFVEVKGEGDRLSTGQELWLQYLKESGAMIEVCWVHSTGSKHRKIKTKRDVTLNQPEQNEARPSNKPD